MSGGTSTGVISGIGCPRCDHAPFPDRGAFAAHLVEIHRVGASRALSDARAAFGITEPAPRPHVAPAPAPAPVEETPMPRKDAPKPKYKRPEYRCGACGSTTHTARSSECPRSAVAKVAETKPFQMQDRGAARKARSGGGSASDAIRAEIAQSEKRIAVLKNALTRVGRLNRT